MNIISRKRVINDMKDLIKEAFGVKNGSKMIVVGIITSIIYSIINTLITIWIAKSLQFGVEDLSIAYQYLMLIVIACVVNVIISFINDMICSIIKHLMYTELNNNMSEKLAGADYSFFENYGTNYITTVNGSLTSISKVYNIIMTLIDDAMSITITIIAIAIINKVLIIPIFIIYTAGLYLCSKLFKRIQIIDTKFDNEKLARNKELQMLINGFSDVRTMCTQNKHLRNIYNFNKSVMVMITKRNRLIALSSGLCETLDGFITISAIVISIFLINNGLLQNTIAMSLVMYAWRLTYPLIGCLELVGAISETIPQFKKYKNIMDYENKVIDGDVTLTGFSNEISIENLSFAYNTSDTVLNDISIKIHKGEKIGICGTSGEGKSTIIKLLNRFYDPNDGSICIDGMDIRHFTLDSLRNRIGTVSQKVYIFEGTVKENIIYGNHDVSEYDVIEASKKACLYDFIQSLPEKFNTNIGVDGLKLSGGQQQRIALARIFLSNIDIVLLDEATSALDNESEAMIQKSLAQLNDKTIIAVAHRLSTIKNFDRIIVFNNHTIAEVGSHEELLKMNGIYASLLKVNK